MTTVLLTNFWEASTYKDTAHIWDAANWSPEWFQANRLEAAVPKDEAGRIYVSHFGGPALYWQSMVDLYWNRSEELWALLSQSSFNVVTCWCPKTRKAKEQIKLHGSFVCHTGPLGEVLTNLGLNVIHDKDRVKLMWKPSDGQANESEQG